LLNHIENILEKQQRLKFYLFDKSRNQHELASIYSYNKIMDQKMFCNFIFRTNYKYDKNCFTLNVWVINNSESGTKRVRVELIYPNNYNFTYDNISIIENDMSLLMGQFKCDSAEFYYTGCSGTPYEETLRALKLPFGVYAPIVFHYNDVDIESIMLPNAFKTSYDVKRPIYRCEFGNTWNHIAYVWKFLGSLVMPESTEDCNSTLYFREQTPKTIRKYISELSSTYGEYLFCKVHSSHDGTFKYHRTDILLTRDKFQ